jgi:hypothetical protein
MHEYVGPEEIAKLLRGAKHGLKPPEVKHFQFVVILTDDTDIQEFPATISAVMGTVARHHAIVSNSTALLLVAVLGVPFPEDNSARARREFVDALLQEHGDRIRVIHGECDGPFGMFGEPGSSIYGAMIPGFSGILKRLLEIRPGAAVETDTGADNG